MQHSDAPTPDTPTIEYGRPARADTAGAVTVFWTIFWLLGATLVLAAVFARMLIRRTDAQLLQISALVWVAARVLSCTKHRLRLRMATVWALSLWLPSVCWLLKVFAAIGLSSLFFWPFGLHVA